MSTLDTYSDVHERERLERLREAVVRERETGTAGDAGKPGRIRTALQAYQKAIAKFERGAMRRGELRA